MTPTPTGAGIAARLRSLIGPQWADDREMARLHADAAAHIEAQAAEIARLKAGWLCMVATENQCDGAPTGQCGRPPEKCGCLLEIAEWMKEPQP